MNPFIIVAIILFVVAALMSVWPNPPGWASNLFGWLGLAFFAASFIMK